MSNPYYKLIILFPQGLIKVLLKIFVTLVHQIFHPEL